MTEAIERRAWELSEFHPAAFDVRKTVSVLSAAVERTENATRSGSLSELTASYEDFLRNGAVLLAAIDVIAQTRDDPAAHQYLRAVDSVVHSARGALVRVKRLIGFVDQPAAEHPATPRSRWLAALYRQAAHEPPEVALPWALLGQTCGFESLGEVHRTVMRQTLCGQLQTDSGSICVSHENYRALLSHSERAIRKGVWDILATTANGHRATFEAIHRARQNFIRHSAKLAGYSDLLGASLDRFRVSSRFLHALKQTEPHIREIAERYYARKRQLLGLSDFFAYDVTAPVITAQMQDLSLTGLLSTLQDECTVRAPHYLPILGQILSGNTFLTDPEQTTNAGWFALPNAGEKPPLVHIPYYRNLECYAAAAHELGHACHFGWLTRSVGEFAAADDSMVFSEAFALHLEIAALHASLKAATTQESAQFWRSALIEQALHFLRTLQIPARFQQYLLEGSEPDAAWILAHEALTPKFIPLPTSDQSMWLLQVHSESMPFYGYAYGFAFILAYLLYLRCDANSLLAFSESSPWSELEDVMRHHLGLNLRDTQALDDVLNHIESLLED